MLIVQDGEEPTSQIGAGLPKMLLCDCSQQAILHEIIGSRSIVRQHTGIAAQPRDLLHEQSAELARAALGFGQGSAAHIRPQTE
jgi:hypothetical protein